MGITDTFPNNTIPNKTNTVTTISPTHNKNTISDVKTQPPNTATTTIPNPKHHNP